MSEVDSVENERKLWDANLLTPYFYFVSFSVLFVCKCVLYYCQRVATQLQLNI